MAGNNILVQLSDTDLTTAVVTYPFWDGVKTRTLPTPLVMNILSDEANKAGSSLIPWVDLLSFRPRIAVRQHADGRTDIIMASPAEVRTVQASYREMRDPKPVVAHFPDMVWLARFQHRKLQDARLYVAERLPLSVTDTPKVVFFPFGNVRTDASICWGVTQHETVSQISDMDALERFFLYATPFTDHICARSFEVTDAKGKVHKFDLHEGLRTWTGGAEVPLTPHFGDYSMPFNKAVERAFPS